MPSSTNYFADDPKTLFLPGRNYHYAKNKNSINTNTRNTIYYNMQIVHFEKKGIEFFLKPYLRHFKYKTLNNPLNLTIIEGIIFNKEVAKLLHFNMNNDLCYKRKKRFFNQKTINIEEPRGYFVFLYKKSPAKAIHNIKKINNNVYVKRIQETPSLQKDGSQPKINDFTIEAALREGFKILCIEGNFLNFNPEFEISKLADYGVKYLDTFQASYYYYVDSVFSEIMIGYYSKVNELILEYKLTKDAKRQNRALRQLNDNTKIILKQNKLLYLGYRNK